MGQAGPRCRFGSGVGQSLMKGFLRFIAALPVLLISPVLVCVPLLVFAVADACWLLFGRRKPPVDTRPNTTSASVVIPNWNGRDLLEKYLPSVISGIKAHPGSEVIVVDNGSSDGSAD